MAKLFNILAVVSIATMLAASGTAGYLFATGKLGGEQIGRIGAILRGEAQELPVARDGGAATSQPASGPSESAAPSSEEARSNRNRERLSRLTLERAAADVAARQALLNQAMQQLISLQEEFESRKTQWTKQQEKLASSALDRGFQKELDYVSNLAPKIAKEHVVRAWKQQKADVVKLFTAIERGKGQKILEQFKSSEEMDIVHELLEQLRLQNVSTFAAGPGKKPGE